METNENLVGWWCYLHQDQEVRSRLDCRTLYYPIICLPQYLLYFAFASSVVGAVHEGCTRASQCWQCYSLHSLPQLKKTLLLAHLEYLDIVWRACCAAQLSAPSSIYSKWSSTQKARSESWTWMPRTPQQAPAIPTWQTLAMNTIDKYFLSKTVNSKSAQYRQELKSREVLRRRDRDTYQRCGTHLVHNLRRGHHGDASNDGKSHQRIRSCKICEP